MPCNQGQGVKDQGTIILYYFCCLLGCDVVWISVWGCRSRYSKWRDSACEVSSGTTPIYNTRLTALCPVLPG